jgi:hypothetical protein
MKPAWSHPTSHVRRCAALAAILTVVAAGCQDRSRPSEEPATSLTPSGPPVTLAVPDRTNENVSLAVKGDLVVATWSAAPDLNSEDIYAAISGDRGATFEVPVRVNAKPGEARVNGEQPPRAVVVDGPDGDDIDVIWTTSGPTGIMFAAARSRDRGESFVPVDLPPDVNAQGSRGWPAFAPSSAGGIDAVWLDHRRLAPPPGSTKVAHQHDHSARPAGADMDTVAMAQLSDLYFASFNGHSGASTTLSSAIAAKALTPGVCYCCKTALAHGSNGAVFLAWRHVYPGDMRDIAVVSSRDGGKTFGASVRVHEDQWSIKGCPDDGPAMAVDGQGRVHVVWPTMVKGTETATKTILYAMSVDGTAFTPPVRLPSRGHAHHPQLAIALGGAVVVAWDEVEGDGRAVVVAQGTPDVAGTISFVRMAPLDTGVYPTLALVKDRVLAAWVSKSAERKSIIRLQHLQPSN